MRKTLTLILGVALFGILAAVVVASQGADGGSGSDSSGKGSGGSDDSGKIDD